MSKLKKTFVEFVVGSLSFKIRPKRARKISCGKSRVGQKLLLKMDQGRLSMYREKCLDLSKKGIIRVAELRLLEQLFDECDGRNHNIELAIECSQAQTEVRQLKNMYSDLLLRVLDPEVFRAFKQQANRLYPYPLKL